MHGLSGEGDHGVPMRAKSGRSNVYNLWSPSLSMPHLNRVWGFDPSHLEKLFFKIGKTSIIRGLKVNSLKDNRVFSSNVSYFKGIR